MIGNSMSDCGFGSVAILCAAAVFAYMAAGFVFSALEQRFSVPPFLEKNLAISFWLWPILLSFYVILLSLYLLCRLWNWMAGKELL